MVFVLKVKVWKEGKYVLVRNDEYHINTYGKNLEDALKNFQEALLLVTEEIHEQNQTVQKYPTLVIDQCFSNQIPQKVSCV